MRERLKPFGREMDRWSVLATAAMAILPALCVRHVYLLVPTEYAPLAARLYAADIMAWWKSVLVIGVGLWMIPHLCFRLMAGWRPKFDAFGRLCLAAAGCVLLSMLLSDYPVTARWGVPNQHEGGIVMLSYVLALWYAGVMIRSESQRTWLIRLIGAVALANAAIGIGQGLGWDFWQSGPGRLLLGGGDAPLRFVFSRNGYAYGTLYQPNHYGLFMAMASALAAAARSREDRGVWRIYWTLVVSLSLPAVVFSQSRAAMAVVAVCAAAALLSAWRKRAVPSAAPATPAPHPGRRRMIVVSLCLFGVLAAALLLLDGGRLRRLTVAQWERTVRDFRPIAVASPLKSVRLADNRIQVHVGDRELALVPRGETGWSVRDNEETAALAPTGTLPDGSAEYVLPGFPGFVMTQRGDGRIDFVWDDVKLRFFRNGTALFVVTATDSLQTQMTPAAKLPTGGYDRALGGRIHIWSRALPLVADAPFFGSGPGTFALVFPNGDQVDAQRFFFRDVVEDKAHALWVALAVQTGLCGLLAFSLLFAYCLHAAGTGGDRWSGPLFYALLAWALGSLTNDSTVGVTPTALVLAGLAVSGSREKGGQAKEGAGGVPDTASDRAARYRVVKRHLDVAVVLLSLPLVVPLAAAIAVLIKMDSAGPVLFVQPRCGRGRKPFLMYKFRTMRTQAPGDRPKSLLSDPAAHITRAGRLLRRFSLDELPQLYNVLKGELSLVGPRPVLPNETRLLNERDRYGANDITPGITGWAQINGRDFLPAPAKARYDGEYVKNMSLPHDVMILARTIPLVIRGRGVREGRKR